MSHPRRKKPLRSVAYQCQADENEAWNTVEVLELLSDGSYEWDGPECMIMDNNPHDGVLSALGNATVGREVTMIDGELYLESLVKYAGGRSVRWREVEIEVSPSKNRVKQDCISNTSVERNERRKGKVAVCVWSKIPLTLATTLVRTVTDAPPAECPFSTFNPGTIFENAVTGEVYQLYGQRWHLLNLSELPGELRKQGVVLLSLNGSPIPKWKPVKGEVRRFTDGKARRFDRKTWRMQSKNFGPAAQRGRNLPKSTG